MAHDRQFKKNLFMLFKFATEMPFEFEDKYGDAPGTVKTDELVIDCP